MTANTTNCYDNSVCPYFPYFLYSYFLYVPIFCIFWERHSLVDKRSTLKMSYRGRAASAGLGSSIGWFGDFIEIYSIWPLCIHHSA